MNLSKTSITNLLLACSTAAVGYGLYLTFLVVPNERLMGPVQRIFYFHVGSATATYVSFALVLIGSLTYLANRSSKMDALSEAAAEVGFLFCSIVLVSGMIWGHAAWNTWFSWEPRLITFLLLWLLSLSLVLLRVFGDSTRVATQCAVLGLIACVTIPIMIYSIKLLPQTAQLHPQVLEKRGLKEPLFQYTMFVCMFALILFQSLLVWIRYRVGLIERNRS